jgi:hypothetical protein
LKVVHKVVSMLLLLVQPMQHKAHVHGVQTLSLLWVTVIERLCCCKRHSCGVLGFYTVAGYDTNIRQGAASIKTVVSCIPKTIGSIRTRHVAVGVPSNTFQTQA